MSTSGDGSRHCQNVRESVHHNGGHCCLGASRNVVVGHDGRDDLQQCIRLMMMKLIIMLLFLTCFSFYNAYQSGYYCGRLNRQRMPQYRFYLKWVFL
jgi:hypothetical protein